jgi:hypothetical protein
LEIHEAVQQFKNQRKRKANRASNPKRNGIFGGDSKMEASEFIPMVVEVGAYKREYISMAKIKKRRGVIRAKSETIIGLIAIVAIVAVEMCKGFCPLGKFCPDSKSWVKRFGNRKIKEKNCIQIAQPRHLPRSSR